MDRRRVTVGICVLLILSGCSGPTQPVRVPTTAAQCAEPTFGALPEWARAGFSPPDQPMTYFLGASGQIVGVAFGWPLRRIQPSGKQNKILWVAHSAEPGPLRIIATRERSGETVTREVEGGPGPSLVDMPSDGCWRFDLRWTGGSDEMHVRYEEPN